MSIIYDALKKVEKAAVTQNNPSPRNKADYKSYFLYILIAVLGIIAASLFFNFIPAFFKKTTPPKVTAPLPPPPQEQPVALVPVPEVPAPPHEPPQFTLNGIFFSEGQGYALINNQIVRQGDEISGAIVESIAENEVELTFRGSTIKLAL